MAQTASRRKFIAVEDRLFVAFELGWKSWKLAFASGMGEKPWQVTIPAQEKGDWGQVSGFVTLQ